MDTPRIIIVNAYARRHEEAVYLLSLFPFPLTVEEAITGEWGSRFDEITHCLWKKALQKRYTARLSEICSDDIVACMRDSIYTMDTTVDGISIALATYRALQDTGIQCPGAHYLKFRTQELAGFSAYCSDGSAYFAYNYEYKNSGVSNVVKAVSQMLFKSKLTKQLITALNRQGDRGSLLASDLASETSYPSLRSSGGGDWWPLGSRSLVDHYRFFASLDLTEEDLFMIGSAITTVAGQMQRRRMKLIHAEIETLPQRGSWYYDAKERHDAQVTKWKTEQLGG